MNTDFLANFNEQARKMAEPLAKMNQVMLKNAERMTEFSLNTIKNYSELGLNHLRHAAEVKTPEAATDFSAKQTELVNTISQQILQDAQRLTELGNAMRNDLLEVMGESYTKATTEMQAAMNPTADEAKPAVIGFLCKLGLVLENIGKLHLLELFSVGKNCRPGKGHHAHHHRIALALGRLAVAGNLVIGMGARRHPSWRTSI